MQQLVDGRFHERSADLAPHDDSGLDAAQFDQVGDHEHAVEQSQTGVADVEDDAIPGKSGLGMHPGRRRRFHLVATDGAVYQGPAHCRIETGDIQRLADGDRAHRSGQRSGIVEPSFADARHQLETTFRQPEAFINRLQPRFDLVGSDDMRGKNRDE